MKKIFLFTLFLAAVGVLMAQTVEAGSILAFSPLFAGKMNRSFLNLKNADVLGLNIALPQILVGSRSSGRELTKMRGQREAGFYDKPMILTTHDTMKAEGGQLVANSGADFILKKPQAIFTVIINRVSSNINAVLPVVLFHNSSNDSDFVDTMPPAFGPGGNQLALTVIRQNGQLTFRWTDNVPIPARVDDITISMQTTPYLSMLKSMGARKFSICGLKCNYTFLPAQADQALNFTKAGFFSKDSGDSLTPIEFDRRDTFNAGMIEIPMLKEMSTFDGITTNIDPNAAGGNLSLTFYIDKYEI